MAMNSEHLLNQKQAALAQAKAFVVALEGQIEALRALVDLERKTLAMQDSPFEEFLRIQNDAQKQNTNFNAVSANFDSSLSDKKLNKDVVPQPRNTKNAVSRKIVEILEESDVPLTVAEIYSTLNERLENLSTRGSVRGTLFALNASKKIVAHGQGRYSKNGIPVSTKVESPASTGLSGVTTSLEG